MPETYRKPVRILRMGREALQEGGVREWRLAHRLARSIVSRGKLTLFLGDTAVGVVDVGRDGMPGLTFHIPAKKAARVVVL